MNYLGIDPGNKESAFVIFDSEKYEIVAKTKIKNELAAEWIHEHWKGTAKENNRITIEVVSSYGKHVGEEMFATCEWCGVFASSLRPYVSDALEITRVDRVAVKLHITVNGRAKDAQVRECVMDRFTKNTPPEKMGQGKFPVIGGKNAQGPLYGVVEDMWAALAVAITASDKWDDLETFPICKNPFDGLQLPPETE